MFVDFSDPVPPPRWEPEPSRPPRPKLTRREERVLTWLVGLNLAMLLVAPIAGASLVHAVLALFGG